MGRPSNWDENGNLRDIYPGIPLWSRDMYLNRVYKDPTIQQESVFWRRSLWEKAGGYIDRQYELAGDLELWRRFFRYAGLATVSTLIGGFRNHSEQKTKTRLESYFKEAEAIIEEEISLFDHGQVADIPHAVKPVEISDETIKGFKYAVGKLGYNAEPVYFTSTDIRLGAARKALVVKEWSIIKKQNDIAHLESLLTESEADRNARLDAIEKLGIRLEEVETERRLQIEVLTKQLNDSNIDRELRLGQIEQLTRQLTESEADRNARLDAIEKLGIRLEEVETERRLQIEVLTKQLNDSNLDREKRLDQIEQLTSWLKESEVDRGARLERIHDLEHCLDSVSRRLNMLEQTYHALEKTLVVRTARQMRLISVKPLDITFADSETPHGPYCG
jgi:hypothetical protein